MFLILHKFPQSRHNKVRLMLPIIKRALRGHRRGHVLERETLLTAIPAEMVKVVILSRSNTLYSSRPY